MTEELFSVELNTIAHEADRPLPDGWCSGYWSLYQLARWLKPKRICEIGVRAGYSAYAMLRANPTARPLGIEANLDERTQNTHGGRRDLYKHAVQILSDFDFDVLIVDSHDLVQLPAFDLIHVDGDHSRQGCRSDLELAARSCLTILAHDVESIA